MSVLTFHIRLLQPLLVTQLGSGEENSATTFDFIPGSVLRGALINYYLQQHKVQDVAQDSTCRRLFFNDEVCYLNAYPLNRLGKRTLPRPFSWRVSKDEKDNAQAIIYDFAIEDEDILDDPQQPDGTFCWWENNRVELISPKRHINIHNASEDRNIKRKGKSPVYRYEAIAGDEVFGAVILTENEADVQMLLPFLNGLEFNIGGSRSAGYGRVRFENVQLQKAWEEYDQGEEPDEDIVILTLLSDAILRDKSGHLTTNLDAVLGWEHSRAYQQTRVVGGFNRKWGLPLIQTPALQAGSVFVYRSDQIDWHILHRLKQEGIGERRAEGFGRIAINWHTQATLQRRVIPEDSITSPILLSAESQKLAHQLAERRLQAVLDEKLIESVSQLSIHKPPQNAQLSRLRLTIRHAWRIKDLNLIPKHLKNLKRAACDQFDQARIGNKRLSLWLSEGIQENRIWEDWLQPSELPTVAGVTGQITEALKVEYTARLLDALLKKASKERNE